MQEQLTQTTAHPEARRGFFKCIGTVLIGALASLVALLPGGMLLIDPVRRRRAAGDEAFVDVTSLASLPADGVPRRFPIVAERIDAWNRHAATPIGAVFLKRTGENEIVVMNVVCPHLGCAVRVETSELISCPCHDSEFDTHGRIIPITRNGNRSVSPRDLDTLEVRIENGRVLVRFQNFRAGVQDKIPV